MFCNERNLILEELLFLPDLLITFLHRLILTPEASAESSGAA